MNEPSSHTEFDESFTSEPSDGITTESGMLPNWWKWMFTASVFFAPAYMFMYHNGAEGRSLADSYDSAMAENMQLQFAEIGELTADRDTVVEFLYRDSWLQVGKIVFKSKCATCHARDGGGQIGPNLTDDSYKHIRDIGDILRVVQNGANGGAMPAWKSKLSVNEIVLVSSYVASLRGTTPATSKPAEGNKITPWPEASETE